MKENSGSINQVLFSVLTGEGSGRIITDQLQQMRLHLLQLLQKILPTAFATLAMGMVYFICVSLFLYQLAEHGW